MAEETTTSVVEEQTTVTDTLSTKLQASAWDEIVDVQDNPTETGAVQPTTEITEVKTEEVKPNRFKEKWDW